MRIWASQANCTQSSYLSLSRDPYGVHVPSVWISDAKDCQCLWVSFSSLGDSLNYTVGIVPCSPAVLCQQTRRASGQKHRTPGSSNPLLGLGVNPHSQLGWLPLTKILTLVFDNSSQVKFHQLLFWVGNYGRSISRFRVSLMPL